MRRQAAKDIHEAFYHASKVAVLEYGYVPFSQAQIDAQAFYLIKQVYKGLKHVETFKKSLER